MSDTAAGYTDRLREAIERLEESRDCSCSSYIGGPDDVRIYHDGSCRHYVQSPPCPAAIDLGRCNFREGHGGQHQLLIRWSDEPAESPIRSAKPDGATS